MGIRHAAKRANAPADDEVAASPSGWEAVQFLDFERRVIDEAEAGLTAGMDSPDAIRLLRRIGLETWGRFLWELPKPVFPQLSSVMPTMSPAEVQRAWTGCDGEQLLLQSTPFVRYVMWAQATFGQQRGRDLAVLDFGCGYGRIARLMLKYVESDNLWGVDPWPESIDLAWQAGFRRDRFLQSEELPTSLPVPDSGFDLVYAFSVATHLSPTALTHALSAIKKCLNENGILVVTLRPREFWNGDFHDTIPKADRSEMLAEHDRQGVAFRPQDRREVEDVGVTFGDISWEVETFAGALPDWHVRDVERLAVDPYQVYVTLSPRS